MASTPLQRSSGSRRIVSPAEKESETSFYSARSRFFETAQPSRTPSNSGEPNQERPASDPVIFEEPDDDDPGFPFNSPYFLLLLIFIGYLLLIYNVYLIFPEMKPEERKHITIPWNMDEAKALASVLDRYTDKHYYTVLFGFAVVYLFLQTFAIPGSIFLSIMSGFLFSFWTALFLVCFCSASGATCCYFISWLVARSLVETRFAEIIQSWRGRVNDERDNLLNFIIFLRITPILPNWLINIVAPHIGVTVGVFWFGTFIGVAPPSILAVQAGRTLNMMTSPSDHISWTSIIILALIALGTLIPVLIRRVNQRL